MLKEKMNEIIFENKAIYFKDIKHLQFQSNFNESLHKYISNPIFNEVESIHFGSLFDQNIDSLNKCDNLKYLQFGYYFNKSTDNLPKNLKTIIYGYSFNKSLNNLPQIEILKLGFCFQQSLDFLPSSLLHLELLFHYPHNIRMHINPFKNIKRNLSLSNLPRRLETLKITRLDGINIEDLPKSIKNLVTDEIPVQYYASYYNSKK